MAKLTDAGPATRPDAYVPRYAELPFVAFGTFWQDRITKAAQWNSELLRFAAARWHKDLDTLVQLANCSSVAEVLCVQFEVAAETASDYLSEAEQLVANVNTALQSGTNAPTGS